MQVNGVDANRFTLPTRNVRAASDAVRHRSEVQSERTQTDKLALSDRVKEIRDALKAVQAAPDIREDRIAELRQRIAEGTYKVPAEDLARDLLGGMGGA